VNHALAAALPRAVGGFAIFSQRVLRKAEAAPVLWFGRQLSIQGWAMTVLGAIGVLCFMRLWVRSLIGEIGVRRSVGARRHQILGWIGAQALSVAVKGVAAGLCFGFGIWQVLSGIVAGVRPWDGALVLEYLLGVIGVVLCGVLLPGWRAGGAAPAMLIQSSGD
jgi:predicted lysophospholipase L1 biosynthesis ABC-type transport system permease subunit